MKITKEIYAGILLHAKKDLPNECCGYLAGKGAYVTAAYALKNIDDSHEHFSFDPEEQFAAIKDMRKKDLCPTAVYYTAILKHRQDLLKRISDSPMTLISVI